MYRVTEQRVQNLPLTSKQKFRFVLAWPGQSGPFVLKSTGGFAQTARSPCTYSVGTGRGVPPKADAESKLSKGGCVKMQTTGRVKKSENLADVICTWPLMKLSHDFTGPRHEDLPSAMLGRRAVARAQPVAQVRRNGGVPGAPAGAPCRIQVQYL